MKAVGTRRPRRVHSATKASPSIACEQLLPAVLNSPLNSSDDAAEQSALGKVDLSDLRPAGEVLALVPRALAVRHILVPLARESNRLRVAVHDPLELEGVDSLRYLTQLEIVPVLAQAEEICAAIERWYGKTEAASEVRADGSSSVADQVSSSESGMVHEAAGPEEADAPIIQLVHAIILEGRQRRASDIHFEPLEKRFRVRYRIDGVLWEREDPPHRLQLAMISRIKIMANISIAEKRLPQDGRIQINAAGRSLDLRVSSLPTAYGESIVMRLLDPQGLQLGLPELGFWTDDQRAFERLIALPDGIVLVTGPTGSGKTTTLYSCLHHLNQPNRKIITVEDPVEYQLSGINQVPVRQEIGMTFASALRAMLRQSPNIVMVGEIRDRETAEIAIHAALTGHMVFSTLHTNDAPGAISRLVDIGVKPFLVATSLRAVLAQRLVRKICPRCQSSYQPRPDELYALNLATARTVGATFMKGGGCPECDGTGYRGRLAIFELLVLDEGLQGLIYDQAGTVKLREKARAQGMRTLREDGVRKITAGLTTIEEVVSITAGDPH